VEETKNVGKNNRGYMMSVVECKQRNKSPYKYVIPLDRASERKSSKGIIEERALRET
jgi:hypothetical protein